LERSKQADITIRFGVFLLFEVSPKLADTLFVSRSSRTSSR
jgi:hypothetical protein